MAKRTVQIHAIELLSSGFSAQEFEISIACSKGTYIRALAVDIAAALGTVGHLSSLRRTHTGGFDLSAAKPLDAWMECDDATRASWLLPTDSLVAELPCLSLTERAATDIKNGKIITVEPHPPDAPASLTLTRNDEPAFLIRLYDPTGRFLGLGKLEADNTLRAERLMGTHGD